MEKANELKTTFKLGGEMEISRLGYGSMQLTGSGVWGDPADRDQAIRVLRSAVENGVNFIDTADSYGPHTTEVLIHEALEKIMLRSAWPPKEVLREAAQMSGRSTGTRSI